MMTFSCRLRGQVKGSISCTVFLETQAGCRGYVQGLVRQHLGKLGYKQTSVAGM